MHEIIRQIPDQAVLLALEPEELGGRLLALLAARGADPKVSIHNEINSLRGDYYRDGSGYPDGVAVQRAVTEAFAWLSSSGLIVPDAEQNGTWHWLSRRGKKVASEAAFRDFRAAQLLPKELLHAHIRHDAWNAFVRGDYDVAVFQAMKSVEIAVREAAMLGPELLGVKLARTAFHPETGPLTDMNAEAGERQARADLFAGSLGSYKNPQSHRHVSLDDPAEAIEQILLASHLLRVVDGRR